MLFLAWLTAIAIVLHNLEEMIWLPAWSQEPKRIMTPLVDGEFRFAAGVFSLFALALPYGVSQNFAPDLLLHVLAGFACAMIANAVMPHLILSLATRSYMPGLGTGLCVVTPLSASFLVSTKMGFVDVILWGAGVGASLLIAIPILYEIKRRIFGNSA